MIAALVHPAHWAPVDQSHLVEGDMVQWAKRRPDRPAAAPAGGQAACPAAVLVVWHSQRLVHIHFCFPSACPSGRPGERLFPLAEPRDEGRPRWPPLLGSTQTSAVSSAPPEEGQYPLKSP